MLKNSTAYSGLGSRTKPSGLRLRKIWTCSDKNCKGCVSKRQRLKNCLLKDITVVSVLQDEEFGRSVAQH